MADEEPAKVENANFRYHHHSLRCLSNSSDPFLQASYRRKSFAQWFHAAQNLCESDAVCQIIEKRLRPYHAIVDERTEKSVNNYADAAVALASNAGKSDISKWKSNLRNNRPVLLTVKKLTECPGKCFQSNLNAGDLKILSNSAVKDGKAEKTSRGRSSVSKMTGALHIPNAAVKEEFQNGKSFEREEIHCSREPLARSNSLDQSTNGGTNTFKRGSSYLQVPTMSNARPTDKEGLFRSVSNDFESCEVGGSRRKGVTLPSHELPKTKTFGGKEIGNVSSTPKWSVEASRNAYGNVMGPQSANSFSRGASHINPSFSRGASHINPNRGGDRGTGFSAKRNQQNNQTEGGISSVTASIFRTARDELSIQNQKRYGSCGGSGSSGSITLGREGTGPQKRSLGPRRAGVHGKFVPPIKSSEEDDFGGMFGVKQPGMELNGNIDEETDERLKNIDPKMVETIRNEIMDVGAPVEWDDIAGLEFAKTTIQEIVVWPLLRPDIFTGLRKPPKGLLLFGPPGTGKTLIGKCIASQSQSTFFSISASSLTSKWIGDGEKMVRALFAVAKVHQPSVVFIDEIDSLLTQRSDTEHESSRRIKTEFLVQLDGAGTGDEERILVVGATNRPQELDEAARRRLVKRLYIPLPEFSARRQIVERLMSNEQNLLSCEEIDDIASLTDGYSGADMKNLCQEASLGPIRSISFSAIHQISADQVRPITVDDFKTALQRVRASVSSKDLDAYVQWDKTYGMGSGT